MLRLDVAYLFSRHWRVRSLRYSILRDVNDVWNLQGDKGSQHEGFLMLRNSHVCARASTISLS